MNSPVTGGNFIFNIDIKWKTSMCPINYRRLQEDTQCARRRCTSHTGFEV